MDAAASLAVAVAAVGAAAALRLRLLASGVATLTEHKAWQNLRLSEQLLSGGGGLGELLSLVDDGAWAPAGGRHVGRSTHPALVYVVTLLHRAATWAGLPVTLHQLCVVLPAVLGAAAVAGVAGVACELSLGMTGAHVKTPQASSTTSRRARALWAAAAAAALLAVTPAHVHRSSAGLLEEEVLGVALTVVLAATWLRALRTGSAAAAAAAGGAYAALVWSWSGYAYAANLLALHAGLLLLLPTASEAPSLRVLHAAYTCAYGVGTLLSAPALPVVGWRVLRAPELLLPQVVLLALQWARYGPAGRSSGDTAGSSSSTRWLPRAAAAAVGALAVYVGGAVSSGALLPWSDVAWAAVAPPQRRLLGGSLSQLLASSLTKNQPPPREMVVAGFYPLLVLAPLGVLVLVWHARTSAAASFGVAWLVTAAFFTARLARCAVLLAPAAAAAGGVAAAHVLYAHWAPAAAWLAGGAAAGATTPAAQQQPIANDGKSGGKKKPADDAADKRRQQAAAPLKPLATLASVALVAAVAAGAALAAVTGSRLAREVPFPSLVLAGQQPDGSRIVLDDFREAYAWVRSNTPTDATLLTWWDNANELRVLANRSVVVDASGAHPALVADAARALLLPDESGAAAAAVRRLGADYVVLHFGGASGYSSDDVGKAAWMARLAAAGHPGDVDVAALAAGLPPGGRLRIDRTAHPALHASALYRLSYARFDRVVTDHNRPSGFDMARGSEMGRKGTGPSPRHWQEVHTSPHWLVRVFKVMDPHGDDAAGPHEG